MITGAMLCTRIVLNLIFIRHWGMRRAALATAAALSGSLILAILRAKPSLGIQPYDPKYFKGFLATLVMIAALLLVDSLGIRSLALSFPANVLVARLCLE